MDRQAHKKIIPSWGPTAARLALGLVFVVSGTMKAAAPPEEFSVVIEAYDLVPQDAALTLATFLPWVELLAGFSLLFGYFNSAAAGLAGGMLLTFIGAILSTKAKGIELPNCGCFGGGFHPSPSVTMVMDVGLAALAVFVFLKGPGRLSLDNWADGGYT